MGKTGERKYQLGVSNVALYKQDKGAYPKGVAWNGITAIKESPDGADATDLWADNIKYGSIRAGEKYNFTPEAYFYPPEFGECDGSAEVAPGVTISQQKRKPFGLTWQTLIGSDEDDELALPCIWCGAQLHLLLSAAMRPTTTARMLRPSAGTAIPLLSR